MLNADNLSFFVRVILGGVVFLAGCLCLYYSAVMMKANFEEWDENEED